MAARRPSALTAPFLKRVSVLQERGDRDAFPFDRLPYLAAPGFSLAFPTRVTLFVGENGSGKSTMLEAIADLAGFPTEGGSHAHQRASTVEAGASALAAALRPEWLPRVRTGFYLRAESFYDFAAYLDTEGDSRVHGGRALHARSHGESVLAVLNDRLAGMARGLILMDEPEAALSPTRQLAFLGLLRDWDLAETVQVIVATHAPILLCYPGATLYRFDAEAGIAETRAEETEHVRVTKAFLANPDRYLKEVFADGDGPEA